MAIHQGRRPELARLAPPASVHAGLWLARFLEVQILEVQTFVQGNEPQGYSEDEADAAKGRLIDQIVGRPIPDGYREAYLEWREGLRGDADRVAFAEAEALGRVLVGAGQKGPAEFGISLHHTWGLPYLPGSSLKGIAAAAAHRFLDDANQRVNWERRENHAQPRRGGPNAYDALFGDVDEQGAVIFHDAWLVPQSGVKNGLVRDVLTVHHRGYYQREEDYSESESPVPVAFVSARGSFLVALELHPSLDPATHGHWLEAAWLALREGLSRLGVGAKTNAGYGRVSLPPMEASSHGEARRAREAAAERARVAEAERAARAAAALLREQRATARAAMASAGERIRNLAENEGRGDEWFLATWLRAPDDPGHPGVPRDEAHAKAAFATLDPQRRDQVKQQAPDGIRPWLVLEQARGADGFGQTELSERFRTVPEKVLKKQAKLDEFCKDLTKTLTTYRHTRHWVEVGLQHLGTHGTPKQRSDVRSAYGLGDGE